ncbi:MAG: PAS domain S-box protein, partial [Spirochaetes bacterium]|nr:PAS domain S-box protein [Spirochaetota bacterium]
KAVTSGRTAASVITRLPWSRPQPAVAVFRPVFGGADESGTRRVGIVIGLVCLSSVSERAILSSEPAGLPTVIRDAGAGSDSGASTYAHDARIGGPVPSGHRNAGLAYSQAAAFADRTWIVEVRPSSAYGAEEDKSAAYFSVAGIVASLALGGLVLSLVRAKAKAEALADAKSGEFELFFTTSLDLFALAGVDGTFKRLNRQWESALGYSVEELQGQRFLDFVHPDDRAATTEAVSTLSAGVDVAGFVNRYRTKGGAYRSMEWRSTISGDRATIFAAARDITDRVTVEEVLRRSLQEKEALLKEVHHRVKNNMQVISSLLDLEAMKSDEPGFAAAAKEAQGRIRSMAMVHEQLYKQDSASAVDLGAYIKELSERVVEEHSGGPVSLTVEADTVLLDLDTAIPCGLAVNELLTNAFKYACKGRAAVISVTAALGSGLCAILVEDDGPGLPAGAMERSEDGQTLGLSLVSGLAQQLHGELLVLPGAGARFELRFPYEAKARASP